MGSLLIRRLDDQLKARLRLQAARHGRSMEEEAREILRFSLSHEQESDKPSLAESIRSRVASLGRVELELPVREPVREPPDFSL